MSNDHLHVLPSNSYSTTPPPSPRFPSAVLPPTASAQTTTKPLISQNATVAVTTEVPTFDSELNLTESPPPEAITHGNPFDYNLAYNDASMRHSPHRGQTDRLSAIQEGIEPTAAASTESSSPRNSLSSQPGVSAWTGHAAPIFPSPHNYLGVNLPIKLPQRLPDAEAEDGTGSDLFEGHQTSEWTGPGSATLPGQSTKLQASPPHIREYNSLREATYGELGENSEIWRTYVTEIAGFDKSMVAELGDSADVLLVFAGLFSAVVTTFVVQTYQSLQPDFSQLSASLIYEMVSIQRSLARGDASLSDIPPHASPAAAFTASTVSVWVNGLWFCSLALSLTAALLAVLVKQWLHHYSSTPPGTVRQRSEVRQFRHAGFQIWRVPVIVGLLPVILHSALAIFFVGMVLFLSDLHTSLSWIIGSMTVVTYTCYIITNFLPVIYPQCPYHTPLSDFFHLAFLNASSCPRSIGLRLRKLWLILLRKHTISQAMSMKSAPPHAHLQLQGDDARTVSSVRRSLLRTEMSAISAKSTTIWIDILYWLYTSSDASFHSYIVEAIGAIPYSVDNEAKLLHRFAPVAHQLSDLQNHLLSRCLDQLQIEGIPVERPLPGMEATVERLLRFEMYFPRLTKSAFGRGRLIPVQNGVDTFEFAASVLGSSRAPGTMAGQHLQSHTAPTFLTLVANMDDIQLPALVWLRMLRNATTTLPVHSWSSVVAMMVAVFPLMDQLSRIAGMPTDPVSLKVALSQSEFRRLAVEMFLLLLRAYDRQSGTLGSLPKPHIRICHAILAIHDLFPAHDSETRIKVAPVDIDSELSKLNTERFALVTASLHSLRNTFFLEKDIELPTIDLDAVLSLVSTVTEDASLFNNISKAHSPLPLCVIGIYMELVFCRQWGADASSSVHWSSFLWRRNASVASSSKWGREDLWKPLLAIVEVVFKDDIAYMTSTSDETVDATCALLRIAFWSGDMSALSIFWETGLLVLMQRHIDTRWSDVVVAYLQGLQLIRGTPTYEDHVARLHEADNLFHMCIVLLHSRITSEPADHPILCLASVCPDHPSWTQCRARLTEAKFVELPFGELKLYDGSEDEALNDTSRVVHKYKTAMRLLQNHLDNVPQMPYTPTLEVFEMQEEPLEEPKSKSRMDSMFQSLQPWRRRQKKEKVALFGEV